MGRLGDPCDRFGQQKPNKTRSKSIRGVLGAWESERLVVAMKRGSARGAKGPWQKRCGLKEPKELIGG